MFFIKISFFLICISAISSSLSAQTLNLPPRSPNYPDGDSFANSITNLSLQAREDSIYEHVIKGNIPSFQRNLVPITKNQTLNGTNYTVTYYVLPDYLAIGSDANYFLCPTTPGLAQKIAHYTNTTLPTSQMVNEIYNTASLKLSPITLTPGPQMTTVPYFEQHNDAVRNVRQNNIVNHPLGTLVGGDKKDVILSNEIYENGNEYVVIYGWHTSVNNPIQPVYNGHSIDYVDYSHGIRLVQNKVYINGDSLLISDALQDPNLHQLFSSEGQITTPFYPFDNTLNKITSFAVTNENATTIRVLLQSNPVEIIKVQLSSDGINFWNEVILDHSNPLITGLTTDQIQYIRLVREFNGSFSLPSEVLAAIPSDSNSTFLIVNGFDRNSVGNTYNFIRQHGSALHSNNYIFSSATNDAISENLINLNNYSAIDYILGEESSQTHCLDQTEQIKIQNYLDQGGYLFISGSEIGWDLQHLGSNSDTTFYHQYLKAAYIEDAPNNAANSVYSCSSTPYGIFNSIPTLQFDDGTNGTYNVDWPDVISPVNGASKALYYTSDSLKCAAISYQGNFGSSSIQGKLVYFAFPFETIYPVNARDSIMGHITTFFFDVPTQPHANLPKNTSSPLTLYPNPFRDVITLKSETTIDYSLLQLFDANGQRLIVNINAYHQLDLSSLNPGVYFIKYQNKAYPIMKVQ
ncbi:MAG: T9SS type A sorting domain-containing protein [Flavobacteriales bacterium]|jgi:hypothetical protein|nr:T9SS type A sorting domain-containing protein [Flavobacteriales bacterium]